MKMSEIPLEEYFAKGHRACQGCGVTIAVRLAMKIIGKNSIIPCATSCLEIVSTPFPETAWEVPWIHAAFECAAAVSSGVTRGIDVLMRKGKWKGEKPNIVAFAGDGGTFDIGIQALSGALERGDDFTYICLDNEAYMNTGIQRSGGTPFGAWTTTSPPGKLKIGKEEWKKDLATIVAAHHIPYVATAGIAQPMDLLSKVKKAVETKGPSFIHIQCPCPTGWRFEPHQTVTIAKTAVQTGMWVLYEVVNGEMNLTYHVRSRRPVKDYLRAQGRFRHLSDEDINYMDEVIERRYKELSEKRLI